MLIFFEAYLIITIYILLLYCLKINFFQLKIYSYVAKGG